MHDKLPLREKAITENAWENCAMYTDTWCFSVSVFLCCAVVGVSCNAVRECTFFLCVSGQRFIVSAASPAGCGATHTRPSIGREPLFFVRFIAAVADVCKIPCWTISPPDCVWRQYCISALFSFKSVQKRIAEKFAKNVQVMPSRTKDVPGCGIY